MTRIFLACTVALVTVFASISPTHGQGETIVALTTQNGIEIFDSATPGISDDAGFIGGIDAGEILLGIDYRPATQDIYVFGNQDNVYTFDPNSFQATKIGNFRTLSAPGNRFPGNSYGFDFNPAFANGEFARIISNTDDNRVISGNTGQYLAPIEKTDVFYAVGDVNAGVNPNIAGIAYTNSVANAVGTQQYGIDASLGVLTTVANNAGTLVTVGSLGVSPLTNELGFDISGQSGIAYASLQSGPNSELYTINLATGSASSIGTIASGDRIRSITVLPTAVPEPTSFALLGLAGLAGLARRRR